MIYFWQLIKFIILKRKNLNIFFSFQHSSHFHFWWRILNSKCWCFYGIPIEPNTCQCFFVSCHFTVYVDDNFVTLIYTDKYYNLLIIWNINITTSNLLLKLPNMPTVVATLISGTKIRKWKTQGWRSWYTPNTCLTLEHLFNTQHGLGSEGTANPSGSAAK